MGFVGPFDQAEREGRLSDLARPTEEDHLLGEILEYRAFQRAFHFVKIFD